MRNPARIIEALTLKTKLVSGFALMLLFAISLGVEGLISQDDLTADLKTVFATHAVGALNAKDAQIQYFAIGRIVRQTVLAQDEAERQRSLAQLADARKKLATAIELLRPSLVLEENRKNLANFESHYALYLRGVDQVANLMRDNRQSEAMKLVTSMAFQKPGIEANAELEQLNAVKLKVAQETFDHAVIDAEVSKRLSLLAMGLTLLFGMALAWLIGRSVITPLNRLRDSVERLAEGKLNTSVPHVDYPNEVGELARSVTVLQREARQMEAQRSIKAHIAEISSELQQATRFTDLSQKFLSRLAPLIRLGHGVFFIFEPDQQRLRLLGSYAYRERKNLDQYFAMGQGLVGQCAMEMAPIIITEPPTEYVRIGSSLGEGVPRSIAVLPVIRNDRLLAVIELATFDPFDEDAQALLDGLMPILAMSLEILERNVKTRQLLEETQRQAENMEKQAARLEEQQVEMEAQQVEIKAAEERSRLILGSVKDGIVGLDNNGEMTFANQAAYEMLGYAEEEFVGQPMHGLIHHTYPDGSPFPRHECRMYLTSQDGTPRTVDDEVLWRKDGTAIPVEYSTTPVFKNRQLVGTVIVYRDITERKQAEQAILRSKEVAEEAKDRADTFLNASTSSLVIINAQAQIVDCNEGFLRLLDYQRLADVAGKHPAALAPETQPDGRNSMEKGGEMVGIAIERGRHTFDWACQDAHGVSIPVEVTIVPVMLGGQPHLMGIWYDLRSRVAMEEELRAAKAAAEEATKTKSDFLANMSHEIRTPMNAIIGMSHLALQTQLDKKQKNYIEKVHRAGENLLGIINDILDFSKIEAGKMSVEAIDFRLEDVMDHLSNLVGLKAEDKGLELLFNIAPNMPTALVGDPLRLGQILINLGNNAVKFTDKGEIIVGGEMVNQTESEAELHFWVHDSGIGMTPDQCGKMFQSFSQADASTTRKYGGTGLGLAISKNLVEIMHGKIWVESEAGKGSTFHFHIKLGVQKEPMARRMFKADELLGVRVLVVDDNASAREILAAMAKNFGLEVDAAWNGQNALQMLAEAEKKQLPYDLVLMDWKMPGMDGIETVQKMQDDHLSKVPAVIMVTAYGREEALGNAEQQGVQLKTVLTKPVTQSSLLEAIGEVLGKGDIIETRAEEKAETYEEAMAQLKGARVLLAEDNEMNQELAMELLSQAGIEVVLANNGQEAVDILSKDANFDGVLMDCQMPVMDGYTATREIRKLPQFDKLPIIAMTANAMAGDKEKVIEAGMWDHIAKPLNVGEMFATIAKWIKPASQKVGAGGTATEQPTAAAPSAKPVGGLPPLPGIDVKAGMATCTNKESLYTRMLIKFRDSQGKFAELFAAAKADPDPVAPTRCAHTLKGTAGNIGAKDLQAAAAELEHACLEGKPAEEIEALFQMALAELAVVMPGLAKVGAGGTAAAPAPAIPEAELKAKLDKLRYLLKESDSEAGDLLSDLLDKLGNTPLAKQLKPVATAIEGFDFDEALEKLAAVSM